MFRRRKLPAGRRPTLEADERIVAWAGVGDDEYVVLTNRGIWLPGADARLGWHEIHKATWSGRQLALIASQEVDARDGYVVVADRPAVVYTLLDPENVPVQVRTRVTKSIAYTSHHALAGGGGARVVARRVPGVNGLRWTVRYDEGVDASSAEVAAATAELVEHGRSGIEGIVP
nr:hypothetical protein [Planosporangium flavigriseum]